MITMFEYYPDVGAVGPASNAVLRWQSMGLDARPYHEVSALSGFCFLTRKEIIEKIGLLDESLFGGDDIDYSIRIRDANYKLVCCRKSFVYHYYAQTGKKLHPDWDSKDWAERISLDLIRKHGFRKYYQTMLPIQGQWYQNNKIDLEKEFLRLCIPDNGAKIYDMGCGNNKIYPTAIGVDSIPDGELGNCGPTRYRPLSGVNIVSDLNQPLPIKDEDADYIIGKHVLEHIVDHLTLLAEWHRILKPSGKLYIAYPDNKLMKAIACDPTHVHVLSPQSIRTALRITGYTNIKDYFMEGCWSWITEAEKI